MKSTQKIIELIAKGDPAPILAEESLVADFNMLLKYELIDIRNDRLVLTEKGQKAKEHGLERVISELKAQEKLKQLPVRVQKKNSRKLQLYFGLCLSLAAFFLIVSFTNCSF